MKNSGKRIGYSAENPVSRSERTPSRLKSLNSVNPLDREFDFELWATLVRSQMQAALRR
jgi:hypothetical protein